VQATVGGKERKSRRSEEGGKRGGDAEPGHEEAQGQSQQQNGPRGGRAKRRACGAGSRKRKEKEKIKKTRDIVTIATRVSTMYII